MSHGLDMGCYSGFIHIHISFFNDMDFDFKSLDINKRLNIFIIMPVNNSS